MFKLLKLLYYSISLRQSKSECVAILYDIMGNRASMISSREGQVVDMRCVAAGIGM
jgi:hypothetical protein